MAKKNKKKVGKKKAGEGRQEVQWLRRRKSKLPFFSYLFIYLSIYFFSRNAVQWNTHKTKQSGAIKKIHQSLVLIEPTLQKNQRKQDL